jgi:hypothetical protein
MAEVGRLPPDADRTGVQGRVATRRGPRLRKSSLLVLRSELVLILWLPDLDHAALGE